MTKDNQNQIQQREHDTSLGMKKIALYGWDGSNAVMIQVDANGVIQTSGGGTPTLAQVLAAGNATGGNSIIISNSTDEITSATNASINIVPHGSGEIFLGTNAGNIDLSTASGSINLYTSNNSGIDLSPHGTGRVTIGGSVAGVNTIIDDDTMATATSASLSTSESIKAYVDAQSGGGETLAQTLALGNTTGGNDIVVSSGDVIKSPSAATLTLESGATGEGTPPSTTTQSIPDIADANIVSYYKMDDNGIFPEDTTDANLVAWYKFEDGSGSTVTDQQGNYNATLSGTYTWTGAGAFNASTDSVNFGVDSGTMTVGNVTELSGQDQASFSFWFKYDVLDNGVIVSKYSNSSNLFYIQPAHSAGNTYIEIRTAGTNGSVVWNYGGAFSAGTWYYMTVVFDGTQATHTDRVKLYYNTTEVDVTGSITGTIPTTLFSGTNNWLIGNYGGSATNGFDGDIDNFAIYDRVVTFEEHVRNYRKMQTTYIADYVGTNHGAITNATFVSGYFGYTGDNELDFNGTTAYVTVPDSADLSFGNGTTDSPFSLYTWVNSDGGANETILSKYGTSYEYLIRIISGVIYVNLYSNNGTGNRLQITSTTTLTSGVDYFIAITYDGSSTAAGVKIYINGVSDTTNTSGGVGTYVAMTNTAQDVQIGRYATTGYFGGTQDNMVIYNDVRTATEIYNDYINGLKGGGQVGHWKFDDGTGSTAIDSSELGNDGTLTNATWTGSGYFGYTGDNSITFDGTDDSVDIGDIAELSFERTDKFSFDAWVKSSDASNFQVILAKRDSGANNFRGYELFLNNSGYLSAILCNDNSPANLIYVQSTTTLVADGSWHMVSMTYDGSSSASGVKLYVDSTLQSLTTTNNNLSATIDNSISFRIGRREDSAIDFNGVIDTVVVYNYERTASEISAVYTAGIPSGVANIIDTTNAFSSTSKILSIRNNGVEQAYMSGDGKLYNSAGEIAAYSDGGTGGSGSAGAGNQYVELNINGTTYKILHDGTL